MPGKTGGIGNDLLPKRYSSPTLVARGGMGEVYRATDSVLQRTVAVKVLAERHAREPEVRERFEREALAAARLSGARHVITVFDVGEHDGRPFIVMEFVEGGSVHERLRAGRVPREQALGWLEQAGEALDRAHASGIVHRDVKPANLLLDEDGELAVTDFGIASAAGLDTLTLPGTVLGTAGYLSPEQARGEAATPASDRYALGVLAFELLTGKRPFETDTSTTEAFAHVNAPPPAATSVETTLPQEIDAVFARALAKDPGARPATCAELVADLRAALGGAQRPTVVAPPPPSTYRVARSRSHLSRRSVVLVVLALLAAGAAVAALVGATGDRAEDERRATSQARAETVSRKIANGTALNDSGFERMQRGDYVGALPVLERAVDALRGTRTRAEAYASYNLAYTRFALGSCSGVLRLLDRSEQVQGEREEIDALYAGAYEACVEGESRGQGRGRGNDDDD